MNTKMASSGLPKGGFVLQNRRKWIVMKYLQRYPPQWASILWYLQSLCRLTYNISGVYVYMSMVTCTVRHSNALIPYLATSVSDKESVTVAHL